jgi:hypothetical protein
MTASGPSRVSVALAFTSCLRAAPRLTRVTWSSAPVFWLRVAPELPRVPWTGSTSCKQLKFSLRPDHHDLHQDACACIYQCTTRQGLLCTFARHAAGGPLNADETCGHTGCRAGPAQQTCSPITVILPQC